jgi:signal transduction histidine kinase
LLADLASVARANTSTAELCDIREVIAAASEAALAAMEQQSVEILMDVPDGIDLPVVRSHIERVFFNLIANAFEAMAGCGTVRIGARKAGTSVLIELEDTGPGIPACISDRLFEPLITSGKQDGLGLGLALARQTVRNHGGDIWTEPAAGARFVIRLPLDRTNYVPGKMDSGRQRTAAGASGISRVGVPSGLQEPEVDQQHGPGGQSDPQSHRGGTTSRSPRHIKERV